jgi:hypothetical protein
MARFPSTNHELPRTLHADMPLSFKAGRLFRSSPDSNTVQADPQKGTLDLRVEDDREPVLLPFPFPSPACCCGSG